MVKKIKKVSARRCGNVLTESGYAINARHRDIQNRTDDRHNNGDPVSPQDLIALSDDILVGIETELLREKGIAVSDQHVFIRKRGKEHQHKGQDDYQSDQDQNCIDHDLIPFGFH